MPTQASKKVVSGIKKLLNGYRLRGGYTLVKRKLKPTKPSLPVKPAKPVKQIAESRIPLDEEFYQKYLTKEQHKLTSLDKRILKIPVKVIRKHEYKLDVYASELGFKNAQDLLDRYNYLKSLKRR
ncbi:MAG: hypothetical protein DDT29_01175 [Dehalococcoidia bacterium]|nr:hypothetical protein [Bacillota bacterium]